MKNIVFVLLLGFIFTTNAQQAYQPELGQGNYQAVIAKAEKALKINATDSIAHYALGLSYTQLKEHHKAIKNLLKAKNNGLNFFLVQLNLAKNYSILNQNEKAIEELASAANAPGLSYSMIDIPEFNKLRANDKYQAVKQKIFNRTYPCKSDPNYRRFDFWVGEWEVFAAGGKGPKIADSSISLTNGDCGILENYRPYGRAGGHSISYYDATDKKWKQNWVAGGSVSHYVEPDKITKGEMQITAASINPKGVKILLRMSYFDMNEDKSVRQLMERSSDNGKTWTPVYNGLYRRKAIEKK